MYHVTTEKIDNGKGYWNSLLVKVFNNEKQIGSYTRYYSSLMNTFVPFTLNGQDYALFSDDYTMSKVMRLPSCETIAEEETKYYARDYKNFNKDDKNVDITKEEYLALCAGDDANGVEYKYRLGHVVEGFCPVEFFVPTRVEMETVSDGKIRREWSYNPTEEDLKPYKSNNETYQYEHYPVSAVEHAPFGFVAGCQWGDDSIAWKVQYLDLSRIEEGVLTRDERFGYLYMGGDSLKDSIRIEDDLVTITTLKMFSLEGHDYGY